jgi:Uncharacterized conserved protein (DUF2190)
MPSTITSICILALSVKATAALSANRFVTDAGVIPAAAARALGVTVAPAVIGERTRVEVLGTTTVEAGAAVAVGAQVEADALGRGITKAAGVVLGRALTPAAIAGDLIEVLLIPN